MKPMTVVEYAMDLLRHPSFKYAVAYWLVAVFYMVLFIVFAEKKPDPLGKFGDLVESGRAKYD